MNSDLNFEKLSIDTEPRNLLFISEPYVCFQKFGFCVVADAQLSSISGKKNVSLLLGAQSLSIALFERIQQNNNSLIGVEVYIYKLSTEKMAKYKVED